VISFFVLLSAVKWRICGVNVFILVAYESLEIFHITMLPFDVPTAKDVPLFSHLMHVIC
jgi:hypothetical protein